MKKDNKIKINIPFVRQKTHYFCGPASLQMIFGYFNFSKCQNELAKKLQTCEEIGTPIYKMIETVMDHGFYYQAKNGTTLKDVYNMLIEKIPVIVNFIEPTDEESHYAVVSGMTKNDIILDDPWNGKNFKISKSEFLKRWRGEAKRWSLAISRDNVFS